LGYFGKEEKPSHAVVVNLDYKSEAAITVSGPSDLESFDAKTAAWSSAGSKQLQLTLPSGGGKLIRVIAARD
jgi:hypothetical protein